MLEGCINQLLACDEQYGGELKSMLIEFREVLATELSNRVLPNRRLRNEMEIKFVPGTEPIWLKMYR